MMISSEKNECLESADKKNEKKTCRRAQLPMLKLLLHDRIQMRHEENSNVFHTLLFLSTVTGRKKRTPCNLKPVVQRFCRRCFSGAGVKNRGDASKEGDEKKRTADDRCDHYFSTCVFHRDEDSGETMRASKLV
ncbi:hypothetical protein PUN28_010577 [Cardiocondyla obscurior]|uniref:Uncharacterized protein n=1 Tax=Cardiocondyla obscurior TaxID=286306 RepID=A0AAW2FJ85_9HYME